MAVEQRTYLNDERHEPGVNAHRQISWMRTYEVDAVFEEV
jgi:hypothetical protein